MKINRSMPICFLGMFFALVSVTRIGATTEMIILGDMDVRSGYSWGNISEMDNTPFITGLDGVTAITSISSALLPRVGPFFLGGRFSMDMAYITSLYRNSTGMIEDQAMFDVSLDGIAAFADVGWLFPYAFAGITLSLWELFDPNHPYQGAEESPWGVRAGVGILAVPFSFQLERGIFLQIFAGPEAVCGLQFLTELIHMHLRVHGIIGMRLFMSAGK